MKEIQVIVHGQKKELSVSEAKAQRLNRWRDWICTVGVACLYIDFDGMIWRGPCRVGGMLGHMLDDWELPKDTIQCTRSSCDCGTGIKLPKRLDADNYVLPMTTQAFNVQWDLGRRCNFDCSYCWPSSHNKTDVWTDIEFLNTVVTKINEMVQNDIQFNFAGGEPTLHPNFLAFCKHIRGYGNHIHVQTNGSMNIRVARELATLAEISISVHFEFANLRKTLLNVQSMLEEGAKLEVKMMVPPDAFGKMEEFCDALVQVPGYESARVIASPLRDPQTNKLMGYTDEQLQKFGDLSLWNG